MPPVAQASRLCGSAKTFLDNYIGISISHRLGNKHEVALIFKVLYAKYLQYLCHFEELVATTIIDMTGFGISPG